jgi:cyclase
MGEEGSGMGSAVSGLGIVRDSGTGGEPIISDSKVQGYPFRLVARLDVKGEQLIKAIQLEGLRKVGSPPIFAKRYYEAGIDEVLIMDAVASLYRRDHLLDVLRSVSSEVFVPITVGGGVRTISDFEALLQNGADKVAINSASLENPNLLSECAHRFGSQAVVLSVEAKRLHDSQWEALFNCGRESSGRNVREWVVQAVKLGVGEILVTSVDYEGTRSGFDCELMRMVASEVHVPVIASGGMGSVQHLLDLGSTSDVSGVAMADVLHYGRLTLREIRDAAALIGLNVRNVI